MGHEGEPKQRQVFTGKAGASHKPQPPSIYQRKNRYTAIARACGVPRFRFLGYFATLRRIFFRETRKGQTTIIHRSFFSAAPHRTLHPIYPVASIGVTTAVAHHACNTISQSDNNAARLTQTPLLAIHAHNILHSCARFCVSNVTAVLVH